MQTENNTQKKVGSKISAKKVFLWMLFYLCIFFLILFFAVPIYLSSESGKNLILAKVNSSIGGRVNVDFLSMGWFAGVKADRLNFTNNTGSMNLTAAQVTAQPSYLAGRLYLTINDGNFKISAPNANQIMQTLELRDINSKIALRPLGSKSSFDISMAIAGANEVSNISAAGEIKTAEKQWSLAGATGKLSIEVNNLELSTLSPLFAALDVNATASGRVKADINAQMQKGQFENLQGTINASDLDISGSILKGDRLQSSKFQADVKLNTTEKAINIDRLKIEADGLTADVKGTVPKTLRSSRGFFKGRLS